MLDCRNVDSVLAAVEGSWRENQPAPTRDSDVYRHVAVALSENGYVTDTEDGLEILEHCRRAGLPIVDLMEEIENRVRRAGYVGGTLNLADFAQGANTVYVFYDSRRFDHFSEVRSELGLG